ncbi:Target of rapamycin complex 2 subunit mapkap1 [Saguinus oedipus]|uniref:Target of rapamycin complex 2 subunit mapkap1 n=1 Tax=Saguinus oedipus TaxID=9490 RepID=A0ABQ9WF99_SAGOE|nr:Target of rapamycin complex 2 subunit mapkap1 [Saguinus oedipus]
MAAARKRPQVNAAHGFSLIQVDNTKVTMKEILLKAVKRRKGSQKISDLISYLQMKAEVLIKVRRDNTVKDTDELSQGHIPGER